MNILLDTLNVVKINFENLENANLEEGCSDFKHEIFYSKEDSKLFHVLVTIDVNETSFFICSSNFFANNFREYT